MTVMGLFSLTTRLPLPPEDLTSTARSVHLLPIVGGTIALVSYGVGLGGSFLLPPEIDAIAILLGIYALSGLMHLDGLSDFADGVMAKGSTEAKVAAMKDVRVGIAGTFAAIIVLLAGFASLKLVLVRASNFAPGSLRLPAYALLASLLVAEGTAKIAMLTAIYLGRPMESGMGSYFVGRLSPGRYLSSLALTLVIGIPLTGLLAVTLASGPLVGLVVVKLAAKNFGGVNGDALGACNELGRTLALVLCAVVPWMPW